MRTTITVIMCLAAGAVHAQTQVPHTFQSGQPARAAEVNENFSALAESVDQVSAEAGSLDGRLTMLEATDSAGCESGVSSGWSSAHTPTYEYIAAAVGTAITVGGDTGFVLVRVPFAEYGTGQRHVLDFPMRSGAEIDVHFSHVKPVNPDCVALSISGFPATANISDGRTYSWSEPFRTVTSAARYDVSATIWVGETAVTVATGISFNPEVSHVTGGNVYDYTNLLQTAGMPHIDDLVGTFDHFIDYLHIEVAP